jgi:hypothetical protein
MPEGLVYLLSVDVAVSLRAPWRPCGILPPKGRHHYLHPNHLGWVSVFGESRQIDGGFSAKSQKSMQFFFRAIRKIRQILIIP